jgi:glycosyltransferase involved in cell wall biosynthesis
MPLRYLYGPVTDSFAANCLGRQRDTGNCLAFNSEGKPDVIIRPGDTWEDVRRQFPVGWEPDLIALQPAYNTLPSFLLRLPIPKIAIAHDWFLLWHAYRLQLRQCDLVLTDATGMELLGREGIAAQRANLAGCERLFVNDGAGECAHNQGGACHRDIDILFLGNLNPAVQRERAPWAARLANLGRRWRVQIRGGVFGEQCKRLLHRARIVFQFSARHKLGRRAYEAASAGALIFQEDGNREMPSIFRDRQECVYYRADNLEELLEYYLEHEDERAALAAAAREKALLGSYEDLWQHQVDAIASDWLALRDRAFRPDFADPWLGLLARCWQAITSMRFEDLSLVRDLEHYGQSAAEPAAAANAMGVVLSRQGRGRTPAPSSGKVAAAYFERALAAAPEFAVAALNLAETLDAMGRRPEAIEVARQCLSILHRQPGLHAMSVEGLPLCQSFDSFHVEWERAAWSAAGRPDAEALAKRELILWKIQGMLGAWTGELSSFYEAALQRPDLPASRLALGDALMRAGKAHEAVGHLQRALSDNPFDRDAARSCFQVHGTLKDAEGRRRLCEQRRLLAQAAPHVVPVENWFSEPRPRGNELVSVVLFCSDDLTWLSPCLAALVSHTRAPFELIFVHPGRANDLADRVSAFSRANSNVRVELVKCPAKSGFAHRANRGLRRARGRFIALLDGDTLVTSGWIDGLIALALHEWPHVGLVGPVDNTRIAPQGVAIDYQGIEDVDRFAAGRRRAWLGQMMSVGRLTSTCLLGRREVFDRLGALDERFSDGLYAVGDMCLRAREAGLRLLMAQDVFVHHAATAPSEPSAEPEQGLDDSSLLQAKWGSEWTAGFEPPAAVEAAPKQPGDLETLVTDLPSPDLPQAPPGSNSPAAIALLQSQRIPADQVRPGVSLCMIVRDEEANLPECLRSVEGLFNEIIVVDTGSRDGTRDVARQYGARVFEFPWVDSFGAARNQSLRYATCKWLMWLDADDRIDAENRKRLSRLFAGLQDERDAYSITVRSVLDADQSTFRLLDQVRIFRNLPAICWDYRIHEQILPAVNRAGGNVRWTDVVVQHVGYQNADVRRRKLERNLRLLQLDDGERADDSFTLFNLGWTMLDLGHVVEAGPKLKRSLETAKPDSSILRKLYHLLAVVRRQLGAPGEALEHCRQGLERFPDDGELLWEQGLLLRDEGDLAGAELSWSRLLEPRHGKYFASEEVGLRGFRARQLIAEIQVSQHRWAEAEVQWRAALDERLDFEPAWMGLAELFLRLEKWAELDDLLERLDQEAIAPAKVGWLRARAQVQRKEFGLCRKTMAEVIRLDPQAIGPRVLLSHALLQEGRDWQAAERALRDVLELDPDNKDASHNLQMLKRRHAQAALVGS